jgi:hypothetical protein
MKVAFLGKTGFIRRNIAPVLVLLEAATRIVNASLLRGRQIRKGLPMPRRRARRTKRVFFEMP